jgi:aminoglycoside phosphotransferase family enzyme/predicted kinase
MADPQAAVIDWLARGEPWSKRPEMIETHAALVFLIGDKAYKLKKAVDLGYLDFSTVEKRRQTIEREFTLNRRTAPSLYLSAVTITAAQGSFAICGRGEAVDWLLEMRRFPSDALLSHMADRGELDEPMIERLAVHVARFHNAAETVAGGWPKAVARIAREDTDDLLSQADVIEGSLATAVAASRESERAARSTALQHQSTDIRHCHGDLHLRNAFLDHGQPTLFDCIEFDDFDATIQPLYDLAFLLMDLRMRGLHRLANRTLNTWFIHRDAQDWPGTIAGLEALPLYLMLRAEIRAKTEGRRPGGAAIAHRYLSLAQGFAAPSPARLIAIGGLSGTGKSSLAKDFAWRMGRGVGALHLRSDEIRKRLADVEMTARLPPEAYTPDASARVYDKLDELAGAALKAGQAVIVDAVFARTAERASIASIARTAGAAFDGLWLEAPPPTLERRLAERRGDASDADVAVLRQQLCYDLGPIDWRRVDVAGGAFSVAQTVRAHLGL